MESSLLTPKTAIFFVGILLLLMWWLSGNSSIENSKAIETSKAEVELKKKPDPFLLRQRLQKKMQLRKHR